MSRYPVKRSKFHPESRGSKDNYRKRTLTVLGVLFACVLLCTSRFEVSAYSNGQIASRVIGQSSFSTNSAGLTQTAFHDSVGVAFDSAGNLWVSDFLNDRILEFAPPFTNGEAASLVLGSDSFSVSNSETVNQSSLFDPAGIAFDSSGNLWVADFGANRVLEFEKGVSGFVSGQLASLVLGQSSFSGSTGATTQTGLQGPLALAFDSSGNLWVSDTYNDRVLEFVKGAGGFTDDEAASLVLGQSDFTSLGYSISQTGLWHPDGLAFDSSGNLWVTDLANNRVVEYTTPFSKGEGASVVLGATDYTSSIGMAQQNGLVSPADLAFDTSGNLWVSDSANNRIMEFTTPLTTGEDANLVLGQSTFTTSVASVGPAGLDGPDGLTFDSSGDLWVADGGNNRVLEFLSNPYNCINTFCGYLQPTLVSSLLPVGSVRPSARCKKGITSLIWGSAQARISLQSS